MPEFDLPIAGYAEQPSIVGNNDYALPVDYTAGGVPIGSNGLPRVVIQAAPEVLPKDDTITHESGKVLKPVSHNPFEKLLGLNGAERFKTWPEKLITSGVTAAGDALSGKIPQYEVDPVSGDVHTSPQMIERALDMSAVAGTGGLAGTTDATLGATPFLRPALKYKEKLYKGKEGQQHMDVIPNDLYPEFQKMAMSGEDISHYNFGFVNDKGQFLTREKALEYGINTGIIDPQAGKFGALTSTLMADSSKPGVAIEAMAKAEPFYSAVEHQVSQIKQAKMTGDQWLGTLSNKPGVKPEELDWTGLKGFLQENGKAPVTKEQIEQHLASNKVELKEVSKADKINIDPTVKYLHDSLGPATKHITDAASIADARKFNSAFRETTKGMSDEEVLAAARASEKLEGIGDSKYHSYQLPGGENYREMLLTLPPTKNTLNQFKVINEHGHVESTWTDKAKADAWAAKNNYTVREDKPITLNGGYKSSHWEEPNILAHVRMNDRNIDGKKSLHLEEIQSDWHQQGRDKGYRVNQEKELADLVKQRDTFKEQQKKLLTDRITKADDGYYHVKMDTGETVRFNNKSAAEQVAMMPTGEVRPKWIELDDKANALQVKIDKIGAGEVGVPDAPFKKSWHELALKRMIREAAEKGYDRLSWTPGEAQAARYDLSKSVDKLQYNPDTQKLLGHKGNSLVVDQIVPKDKLADFVGKEAADKIMNKPTNKIESPNNKGTFNHYLEGQDLKIGGEGMKGFYDQIIPKSLEKIGKEHGVKVKQTSSNETKFGILHDEKVVSPKEGFTTAKEARDWALANGWQGKGATVREVQSEMPKLHYIDIQQSLKDHAMHRGFPLFSKGVPLPLMPIDHDPFDRTKPKGYDLNLDKNVIDPDKPNDGEFSDNTERFTRDKNEKKPYAPYSKSIKFKPVNHDPFEEK